MQRSDSTKSAAPSAASTEGSYDPLPVTPVRHGGGDGVFGGAVDGSGGGGEDSGDTDRTVPSPARNLSYRSPTTAHVSHKESAMSYREDLMDWHCQPQRDDESDRNQLPEETDHSRDYDSDDVRDDSHARKGRIHRPPTPFALLSDQPEPSQRSPEHHKAVDGDKKGSSHESAEDGNGGRRQSRAPVDMTLELPLPPSSSLSDGNNLRLQPQTLATPSMPDGRRKLFSSRHVLFAAPTPPNTQTAPSLQNGTLSNSPGWTSAPPAITITPPKDSARRRDGRRTVTDGDAAGLFGGALNTDERWADRVKQQQQRSATIWPLTQPPTAGSLNEKKRHNEDEKRRADERRTLSLSELYAARRDGDIVKRITVPGAPAATCGIFRRARKPAIAFAVMLLLVSSVVIGSWSAIVLESHRHVSEQHSRATSASTPFKTSIAAIPQPSSDPMTTLNQSALTNAQEAAALSSVSSSQRPTYSAAEPDVDKNTVTITSTMLENLTHTPIVPITQLDPNPTPASVVHPSTKAMSSKGKTTHAGTTGKSKAVDDPTKTRSSGSDTSDYSGGGYPVETIMRRDPGPHGEPGATAILTIVTTTYVTPPPREQEPPHSTTHDESHETHALPHTTTTTTELSWGPQPGEDPSSAGTKPHTKATGPEGPPATATTKKTKTGAKTDNPPEQPAHTDSPTYCPFAGRPDIWTLCGPRETGSAVPSSASGSAIRNPLAGLSGLLGNLRSGVNQAKRFVTRPDLLFTMGTSWPADVRGKDEDESNGTRVHVRDEREESAQRLHRDGDRRQAETPSPTFSPRGREAHEDRNPRTHPTPSDSDREAMRTGPSERKKKTKPLHADPPTARTTIRTEITDLKRGIESAAALVRTHRRIVEDQRALVARQREDLARATRALREELARWRAREDDGGESA